MQQTQDLNGLCLQLTVRRAPLLQLAEGDDPIVRLADDPQAKHAEDDEQEDSREGRNQEFRLDR
jgi:hypothetical protein